VSRWLQTYVNMLGRFLVTMVFPSALYKVKVIMAKKVHVVSLSHIYFFFRSRLAKQEYTRLFHITVPSVTHAICQIQKYERMNVVVNKSI
jgi:hypothetical protein